MIQLYPDYQVPAFKKLVKHFTKNVVGLMVMATGLGKTIVAASWAKREYREGQKGLFLCHSKSILDQAKDEFRKVIGDQISIKSFYGGDTEITKDWSADEGDIIFATFESLYDSRNPFFKKEFDFIIVDESHHSQAPTYKEVIEYFEPKKLLGITATPNREDRQDIREIFGDEIVDYSLEDAIANGWLSPIEYVVLSDKLNHWKLKKIVKDVLEGGKKVSIKQINETIFIKYRDDEMANIIKEYAGRKKKTIIFCESVFHANNFQKFFPRSAVHHSKEGTPETRRRVLQDFRDGNLQFILAINQLNEGIDVPDAEIIVKARHTDSQNVFFQQLGRGLRKIANKEKVIILDFVGNCHRLVYLKEMARRIKKEAGNNFELTKDILKVSGKGFGFIFKKEHINILEVIERIKNSRKFISDIPHLFAEYSSKNELPVDKVIAGSPKRLKWICSKCGHKWQTSAALRTSQKTGCPACANQVVTKTNNLAVKRPGLAKEYSPKNKLPANKVIATTREVLLWICQKCKHEWHATGDNRARNGRGCPACAGKVVTKTNNLAVKHPKLAKEYSLKNELPANKVCAGANKEFLWICSKCKHEWQALGSSRVTGIGCPACANQVVTKTNNLAVKCPDLAKEYSPKNKLPANKVIAGTNKVLYWICGECEYEWELSGNCRVRGENCPACAGRVVTEKNNLAVTHSELAKEYSLNNKLPANKVYAGTINEFLWICQKCEYEWQASGYMRVRGKRSCLACKGKVVTEKNNLAVTYPKLAKEYSPKNEVPANEIFARAYKKVWWICSVCEHEWQTDVRHRALGRGCRKCSRKKKTQYKTWEEALVAVQKIDGIVGAITYKQLYKGDPKLPSDLYKYKDFPGWKKFLGQKNS